MFQRNSFSRPALILVGMVMLLTGTIQGQKSKKSHPKPIPNDAKPVLWHEPTDIASRDLFLGAGGEAMKPDLSKVSFVGEEPRSYSTKDGVGGGGAKGGVARVGPEAQSAARAT